MGITVGTSFSVEQNLLTTSLTSEFSAEVSASTSFDISSSKTTIHEVIYIRSIFQMSFIPSHINKVFKKRYSEFNISLRAGVGLSSFFGGTTIVGTVGAEKVCFSPECDVGLPTSISRSFAI